MLSATIRWDGWDVWKAFHKLTEHFVQWTDYQDDNSVKCAFLLHKETMRENYSLRKILKKLEEDEEEKKTVILQHTEQEPAEYSYDTKEHDWITSQEMGSSILRETDNMWNPVKNFLKRHKKPTWKAWDGIYIDEEEIITKCSNLQEMFQSVDGRRKIHTPFRFMI